MRSGTSKWRSPSNIAIVKYWGKYDRQLPRNASVSFTLSRAYTETEVQWAETKSPGTEYKYKGKPKKEFEPRVAQFIASLYSEMPFLKELSLKIDSYNSFPHSSGIASSASFMSSLALCLCTIESERYHQTTAFLQRCSHISRLGSGSASRSLYPVLGFWGNHKQKKGSHQEYAVGMEKLYHPVFSDFHNDILIVSSEKKSVSSTAGHALMNGHVYESARYKQAEENMSRCLEALKNGDVNQLGEIMENEALSLHGLMMNSASSYILLKPESLEILAKIRKFRKDRNIPVYFSLDAGPNVHMLYPTDYREEIHEWRIREIDPLCEKILEDRVGQGPIKIA